MNSSAHIVDELESALRAGSTERRIEVLRQLTDLFVSTASTLNPDHVELFDQVMDRLVHEIEDLAIAELSLRLAPVSNAPSNIVRRLAWDDNIAISGPVLAKSERLSDDDLVELSRTKGQAHLAQIAGRPKLAEAVTDVLVERGDDAVAKTLASNAGASFSTTGMWHLATRAEENQELAQSLTARPDLPPHVFRQILTRAADHVKQKLVTSAEPYVRRALERILADISTQVRQESISHDYALAQRHVRSLGQDTEHVKAELIGFANQRETPELIVALSLLSAVPIELVEQLVYDAHPIGLLVLCRALSLDWTFMHAIFIARPNAPLPHESELDQARTVYLNLSVSGAQRALRYWQAQKARAPKRQKSNAA